MITPVSLRSPTHLFHLVFAFAFDNLELYQHNNKHTKNVSISKRFYIITQIKFTNTNTNRGFNGICE
jgi:hypothetical protein